jgi:ribosomal protein L40E
MHSNTATTAQLLEAGHVCRVCQRICRLDPITTLGGHKIFLCWPHREEYQRALHGNVCRACGDALPADAESCSADCTYMFCSHNCLLLHCDVEHPVPCELCGRPSSPIEGCARCNADDDRYL